MAPFNTSEKPLRSVIVVDPSFDAYGELAAAARAGRIDLHLRSSGAAAMKLAATIEPDAWIVATDLDDMSGSDFVELLRGTSGISGPVSFITAADMPAAEESDAQASQSPISRDDLEALSVDTSMTAASKGRVLAKFLSLPAAGIGLATSLIIIALHAG